MRCPNCGFEGMARFCPQCGTPMQETGLVSSEDPIITADGNVEAAGPVPDADVSTAPGDEAHSGMAYYRREPPKNHGFGSKFGAFWRKNKRNKVLVIIAALILISIVRSIIGGIGSPDIDTKESYDWPENEAEEIQETEETKETTEETKETTAEKKKEKSGDEVSADFKETMDEYEAFMNDYVDFMKKYENSDDTASMLVDYGEMMTKYAEFTDKIDAIDEDELSDADYAYYIKVTGRVTEKLSELY